MLTGEAIMPPLCDLSQGLKEDKPFGKEGAFRLCTWSVTAGVAGFLMSEM